MAIPTRGALDDRENEAFEDISGRIYKAVSINATPGMSPVPVAPSGALVTEDFDAIVASYPSSIAEVYTYKTGGVSGTTVATVTVTYTDSTKEVLSTVVRT